MIWISPLVSSSISAARFCLRLTLYLAKVAFANRIDFVCDLKIKNCMSKNTLNVAALRVVHNRSNCARVSITKSRFFLPRGLEAMPESLVMTAMRLPRRTT